MHMVLAVVLSVCALAGGAAAQVAFPNRPLRLVVPYPPGGTADVLARSIGHELGTTVGQPVVIDNRPGGGTAIGAQYVAKSAPDGYTLLFASDPTMSTLPLLTRNLSYDPHKDLVPVVLLGRMDFVLVAIPSVGVTTLEALVTLARSKPGTLNYGSFGMGSQPHLGMELFKQVAGLSIEHIPSKGVAQVVTDLLGGSVHVGFLAISGAPLIKSGKVHGLAIASARRSPQMPDVPTFEEQGFKNLFVNAWWGIVAPAGTPEDVIVKLNTTLAAILTDPEFKQKRLTSQGLEPLDTSRKAFADLIAQDVQVWSRVIERAQIKLE